MDICFILSDERNGFSELNRIDLSETVARHYEHAFERLHKWVNEQCLHLDKEPSAVLKKAIQKLKPCPGYYQYVFTIVLFTLPIQKKRSCLGLGMF